MNSFPQAELSKLIEKHSWKTILLNMIYEGKINPWDIDLDVVVDEFIDKVKKMKKLDLYIPGNLILATSILLKYKSMYLLNYEEVNNNGEEVLEVETPEISFVKRFKPLRPITVNELVEAIENAIKISFKASPSRKSRAITIEKVALPRVEEEDINEKIKRIFSELIGIMDEYGIVRFEDFIKGKEREENVSNFLIMLHMENEKYLYLQQEEIFGEILIKINKEKVIS